MTFEDADAIASLPNVVNLAAEIGTLVQILSGGQNWSTRVSGVTQEYATVAPHQCCQWRVDLASACGQSLERRGPEIGDTVAKQLFPDSDPIDSKRPLERWRPHGHQLPRHERGRAEGRQWVRQPGRPGLYADSRRSWRGYLRNTTRVARQTWHDQRPGRQRKCVYASTVEAIGDLPDAAQGGQDDFTIQSQQDFLNTFNQIAGTFILLGAIAGISLVVGGIGIMNIMLVNVD